MSYFYVENINDTQLIRVNFFEECSSKCLPVHGGRTSSTTCAPQLAAYRRLAPKNDS